MLHTISMLFQAYICRHESKNEYIEQFCLHLAKIFPISLKIWINTLIGHTLSKMYQKDNCPWLS